jgi:hypothetical protein
MSIACSPAIRGFGTRSGRACSAAACGRDAAYVVLAETLVASLVACDARLASAPRHAAKIEVL